MLLINLGSQSPNGQKMLDGITESPVIPLRDCNLDLLCERHDGSCDERLAGVHLQSNEGDHRVSGTNKADSQVPTYPVGTQKTVEVSCFYIA